MSLTDTAIKAARPGDRPYKLFDERTLYLLVHPNGGRRSKRARLKLVRIFHTVRNILTKETAVITSKLTSKAQTTIPQPIRAALKLQEGDELVYEIRGQQVVLTKGSRTAEGDDPFHTFSEWNSAADRKAYGDL